MSKQGMAQYGIFKRPQDPTTKFVIYGETIGGEDSVVYSKNGSEYLPISGEPWVLHSIGFSLDAILRTAQQISQSIGIDNVRIVKMLDAESEINLI